MKIIIEFNEKGTLTINKDDEMSGLELIGMLEVAKNTIINPTTSRETETKTEDVKEDIKEVVEEVGEENDMQ